MMGVVHDAQDVSGCDPKKLQKGTSVAFTFFHVVEELMRRDLVART
jgi:hypothetical protein